MFKSDDDVLAANRVLKADDKERMLYSKAVGVGAGVFTAMSFASNPIGWATVSAVALSAVRAGAMMWLAQGALNEANTRWKARVIEKYRARTVGVPS